MVVIHYYLERENYKNLKFHAINKYPFLVVITPINESASWT